MLKSTRSRSFVDSQTAIINGLASDGGLYVFEQLNQDFFSQIMVGKSYRDIAYLVMRELLSEYSESELKQVVDASYNELNFSPEVISLKTIGQQTYLNLYHGNTFAFKDLALSTLPNLFTAAKAAKGIKKPTVIITATSGDTGSAALAGFKDLKDNYVIVLYPKDGVSEFQELQMNSFRNEKNYVLAVDGNFDDCQRLAKNLFMNLQPEKVLLSSANSINIGRIVPQVVYYVAAYCQMVSDRTIKYGEKINVTVPTGNFGNIYSAYLAKRLGVPLDKLIIASNKNNVLTDLFNHGNYNTDRILHKTISPSMDILVSSNFERYLYELLKHDDQLVKELMDDLQRNNRIKITEIAKEKDFYAFFADESMTKSMIKKVFEEDHFLIDPHTAVAKYVADSYQKQFNDSNRMLIVSTANPYKFSDALLEVFGLCDCGDLEDKMKKLVNYTETSLDPRMINLLNRNIRPEVVKLDMAYDYVKEIVGDIDAKN